MNFPFTLQRDENGKKWINWPAFHCLFAYLPFFHAVSMNKGQTAGTLISYRHINVIFVFHKGWFTFQYRLHGKNTMSKRCYIHKCNRRAYTWRSEQYQLLVNTLIPIQAHLVVELSVMNFTADTIDLRIDLEYPFLNYFLPLWSCLHLQLTALKADSGEQHYSLFRGIYVTYRITIQEKPRDYKLEVMMRGLEEPQSRCFEYVGTRATFYECFVHQIQFLHKLSRTLWELAQEAELSEEEKEEKDLLSQFFSEDDELPCH